MVNFREVGKWGEELGCEFLKRQGFSVIEKNYFATVGEIDIVAQKGDDFYFVEVKTRFNQALANDQAITATKQRRLAKTIKHYCYHRGLEEVGIVPAALIVYVDRLKKSVKFRMVVMQPNY